MFLVKGVLKICNKFTGEHLYRSVILIKLQSNFFEITLQQGCSPVNLLHILRTPFSKNTSGGLLLWLYKEVIKKRQQEKHLKECLPNRHLCSKSIYFCLHHWFLYPKKLRVIYRLINQAHIMMNGLMNKHRSSHRICSAKRSS